MSYKVYEQVVTTTPAPLNLGPTYNDIDASIHIPDGGESVFTGGEDVNTTDHGIERGAGGEYKISASSGTDVWVCTDSGSVTIKIEVND